MSGLSLYDYLGEETRHREYKEAVLSIPETYSTIQDYQDLVQGTLSDSFKDKIVKQVTYDLYRYVPRYMVCFLNSARRRYYSWYYGVNDEGYIVGLPVHIDDLDTFRDEIYNDIRVLMSNAINIVIPCNEGDIRQCRDLDRHIIHDRCPDDHTLVHYYKDGKLKGGYTCEGLRAVVSDSISFQIVPLSTVDSTTTMATAVAPRFIRDAHSALIANAEALRRYEVALDLYHEKYRDWSDRINYFSSKIDVLLSDRTIVTQFNDFTKNYPYKQQDFCSAPKKGECFKVGDKIIRDPPFLSQFRDFRDIQRDTVRRRRPVEPVRPRDIRRVTTNKLALAAHLLLDSGNTQIVPVIIKISCRALQKQDKYDTVAIFQKEDGSWRTQHRRLRRGTPECVGG